MSALAPLLQAYFTDRLLRQRHASPNTIASYRDTFRLLLKFIKAQTGKTPSQIGLEDWNALGLTETGFVGLVSKYIRLVSLVSTVDRRRPRRGRTRQRRSRVQDGLRQTALRGERRTPRRVAVHARRAAGCQARSEGGPG